MRDPMVVGTTMLAARAACRAHHTSGCEGVPIGLVVGGVHLVDGGDGVAASGELHTLLSLHFACNKEVLRCTKNTCCKRTFQVFWMF
jgi:glycerol-3-phosphate dehydrogenase